MPVLDRLLGIFVEAEIVAEPISGTTQAGL